MSPSREQEGYNSNFNSQLAIVDKRATATLLYLQGTRPHRAIAYAKTVIFSRFLTPTIRTTTILGRPMTSFAIAEYAMLELFSTLC
jgi:hypothetical protein